jgi:hypothetical protein
MGLIDRGWRHDPAGIREEIFVLRSTYRGGVVTSTPRYQDDMDLRSAANDDTLRRSANAKGRHTVKHIVSASLLILTAS